MPEKAKLSELKDDKERFVAFSFAAADLLIELDKNGTICYVSGAAKGITGKVIDDLIGTSFVEILDPLDQRVIKYLLDNMKEGHRISPVSARMQNTNVSAVIGACSLPRTHGHKYLSINVSGLPAAQSLAVKRDTETGLLDKNDFVQLANDQLSIATDTGQDLELTLLHLGNLENMANVAGNDMEEFFHQMGSVLRSYSVGGDSAGRLDGDKYGVLHSKSLDGSVLREKVETLSKEVAPEAELTVTPSSINLDKGNLSKENANNALVFVINSYVDADEGTFTLGSLADGLQGRMESTMNRIAKLKSVFLKHDFKLVYQPIVRLKDEEIHHYETLCRFKEGESPFETITFAEEVGIILDLDLAVYKKALEYLKSFKPKGKETPRLAVNISGHSIENDEFVASLTQLVLDNKDVSGNIGFEITETSQLKDLVRTDKVIQSFRDRGLHISLDDLGAGAASFQYIRAIHTDFVKIDGAYVRDALNNERDRAILRSISQLCKDLNIGTIAEMIETKEHVGLLTGMGVNYGQGWLFSKPVPEIDMPLLRRTVSLNSRRMGYKEGWG